MEPKYLEIKHWHAPELIKDSGYSVYCNENEPCTHEGICVFFGVWKKPGEIATYVFEFKITNLPSGEVIQPTIHSELTPSICEDCSEFLTDLQHEVLVSFMHLESTLEDIKYALTCHLIRGEKKKSFMKQPRSIEEILGEYHFDFSKLIVQMLVGRYYLSQLPTEGKNRN